MKGTLALLLLLAAAASGAALERRAVAANPPDGTLDPSDALGASSAEWSEMLRLRREVDAAGDAEKAIAVLQRLADAKRCATVVRLWLLGGPCQFNDPERPHLYQRLDAVVSKCRFGGTSGAVDKLRSSAGLWVFSQHKRLADAAAREGSDLPFNLLIGAAAARGGVEEVVALTNEAVSRDGPELLKLAKKVTSKPTEFDIKDVEKATAELHKKGYKGQEGMKRPLPVVGLQLLSLMVAKVDSDLLSMGQAFKLESEKMDAKCKLGIPQASAEAAENSWMLLAQLSRSELHEALLPCCEQEDVPATEAEAERCYNLHTSVREGLLALAGTPAGAALFDEVARYAGVIDAKGNIVKSRAKQSKPYKPNFTPFFSLVRTGDKCMELRAALAEASVHPHVLSVAARARQASGSLDATPGRDLAEHMIGYVTKETKATEDAPDMMRNPLFNIARFFNEIQESYEEGREAQKSYQQTVTAMRFKGPFKPVPGGALNEGIMRLRPTDWRRDAAAVDKVLRDPANTVSATKNTWTAGEALVRSAPETNGALRVYEVDGARRAKMFKQIAVFRNMVGHKIMDKMMALDAKILDLFKNLHDGGKSTWRAFTLEVAKLAPKRLRAYVRWIGVQIGKGPSYLATLGRMLTSFDSIASVVNIFKDAKAIGDAIEFISRVSPADAPAANWKAAQAKAAGHVAGKGKAVTAAGKGRPLLRLAGWIRGFKNSPRVVKFVRVAGKAFAMAGSAVGVVFDAIDAFKMWKSGAEGGAMMKGAAALLGIGSMVAFWVGTGGVGFVLTVLALLVSAWADSIAAAEAFAAREEYAFALGFSAGADPPESLTFVENHSCDRFVRLPPEIQQSVFANLANADDNTIFWIPTNTHSFIERCETAMVKFLGCFRDRKLCPRVDAIMERHTAKKVLSEVDFSQDAAMRKIMLDCNIVNVESYHLATAGADNWIATYMSHFSSEEERNKRLAALSELKQRQIFEAVILGATVGQDEWSAVWLLEAMQKAGQCKRIEKLLALHGADHTLWKLEGKADARAEKVLLACGVVDVDGWHGLGGDNWSVRLVLGMKPAELAKLSEKKQRTAYGYLIRGVVVGKDETAVLKLLGAMQAAGQCDRVERIVKGEKGGTHALYALDGESDTKLEAILQKCHFTDVFGWRGDDYAVNYINGLGKDADKKLAALSEKKQTNLITNLLQGWTVKTDGAAALKLLHAMQAAKQCPRIERAIKKTGAANALWQLSGDQDTKFRAILEACQFVDVYGMDGDAWAQRIINGLDAGELAALSEAKQTQLTKNLLQGWSVKTDGAAALKLLHAMQAAKQCPRIERVLKKTGAANALWQLSGSQDTQLRAIMESCQFVDVYGMDGDAWAQRIINGLNAGELAALSEEKQTQLTKNLLHGWTVKTDGAAALKLLRAMQGAQQCPRIERVLKKTGAATALFQLTGSQDTELRSIMAACQFVDVYGWHADTYAANAIQRMSDAELAALPLAKQSTLFDNLITGFTVGRDETMALKLLAALQNDGKCDRVVKLLAKRGANNALWKMDGTSDDALVEIMIACDAVKVTGMRADNFANKYITHWTKEEEGHLAKLSEKLQSHLFDMLITGFTVGQDEHSVVALLREMKAARQCSRIRRLLKKRGNSHAVWKLDGAEDKSLREIMYSCDILRVPGVLGISGDNWCNAYIKHWSYSSSHLAKLSESSQAYIFNQLITGFTVGQDETSVLALLKQMKAHGQCERIEKMLKKHGGDHALWKMDGSSDRALRKIMYHCLVLDVTGFAGFGADDYGRALIKYVRAEKDGARKLATMTWDKSLKLMKMVLSGWAGGDDERAVITYFAALNNQNRCKVMRSLLDNLGRSWISGKFMWSSANSNELRGHLIRCGVALDEDDTMAIVKRMRQADLGGLSVDTHARYFRHLLRAYTLNPEEAAINTLLRAIRSVHGSRSAHLFKIMGKTGCSYKKFYDNIHGADWTTAKALLPIPENCYYHKKKYWVRTSGTCSRTTWGTCSTDGECSRSSCRSPNSCKCGYENVNECFCVRKPRTDRVCHSQGWL